jgi:CRISPR-associated protein Csm1
LNDTELKIAIGGMLHDIGKVLYRANDGRNHSLSGYEFLKDEIGITDTDILDQVRYHHAAFLKDARLKEDSPAYITYMADNISAAADRRVNDTAQTGFDKNAALDSIFNILNNNHQHQHYHPAMLEEDSNVNYPEEAPVIFDESFYQTVRAKLKEILVGLKDMNSIPEGYINSLLEVMEATLTYVPSSTSKLEITDISLYDHVKLTAAIGNCISQYLKEKHVSNYREVLFSKGADFHKQQAFLLFSMDMSGIQKYIYHQFGTEDVLKNLRARSFYLDIMMENMADELLDEIGLSRANLIFSGGGHAYMLLPNTNSTKDQIDAFESTTRDWMLDKFGNELYLATGYAECSADDLENKPEGAYQSLFQRASRKVSAKKIHRYGAEDLRKLNSHPMDDHQRECKICHRSDHLTEGGYCEICNGLIQLSQGILGKAFFTIQKVNEDTPVGISIYKDEVLLCDTEASLRKKIKSDHNYVRSYAKNKHYIGESLATKLWVGDYSSDNSIEDIMDQGIGIRRLGVLRADIDNLGQAFVSGFPAEYQTISRSAAFSRKLSMFFKLHINDLLKHGTFSLDQHSGPRNASIIYSGGDDIFIIGAWKDILEFSVDLYHAVQKYTQGTLTFSAGFGLYKEKYPISYIAADTGRLEDRSKRMEGKNAITLFESCPSAEEGLTTTWHWDRFIDHVLLEKYKTIAGFFETSEERGKNFLYNILDLYRNRKEIINLARLAYLLSRMSPAPDAPEDQKLRYQQFAGKLYQWQKTDQDASEVIMAVYLYAYYIRNEEDAEE